MFSYSHSTALVTGASRGIGAEIARALAKRGIARIILTARTESDLEALANELAVQKDVPVTVIPADLSHPDGAQKLYDAVKSHGLTVDLLVNNAGFGYYGAFETAEPGRDDRMIAVNVESLVALTRLFLPDMKTRREGGVINVASTAAFQPVPYMATYGATKAFVLSFSEALWAECRDTGVRVICLCPGGTETAFDFGDGRRGQFENTPRDSPAMVAEVGLDALDKDLPHVVVGLGNTLIAHSSRFVPRKMMLGLTAMAFRPKETSGESTEGREEKWKKPALLAGIVAGVVILAVAIPGVARAVRNR